MTKQKYYTSDNKKVVVIDKLNSQETIVQEIFISNGKEILSGEKFVVKDLYDSPIISWKEKELIKIENMYSKRKDEIDKDLEKLNKEHKKKQIVLKKLIKASSLNDFNIEPFKTLIDFMAGDITHVVLQKYTGYKIITFEELVSQQSGHDRDEIKLISLFGKSDCDFEWKINSYSDGSGTYEHIYPCNSFEEAKNKLNNIIKLEIDERIINIYMLKAKEDYNLKYPLVSHTKKYYKKQILTIKKSIGVEKKKIKNNENKIYEIKKLI